MNAVNGSANHIKEQTEVYDPSPLLGCTQLAHGSVLWWEFDQILRWSLATGEQKEEVMTTKQRKRDIEY